MCVCACVCVFIVMPMANHKGYRQQWIFIHLCSVNVGMRVRTFVRVGTCSCIRLSVSP